MPTVVRQDWEESERGWGERPDGYSLHLSEEDRVAYIDAYWARMPDAIQDEYSRPCGPPRLVDVDKNTYAKIKARRGLRR